MYFNNEKLATHTEASYKIFKVKVCVHIAIFISMHI